jgi:hypothetical protein
MILPPNVGQGIKYLPEEYKQPSLLRSGSDENKKRFTELTANQGAASQP